MSATAAEPGAPSPALAPPPGNPRFGLFDSLRGLAAVAILAFHVCSITGALDNAVIGDALAIAGPRSLTLFFAISGFLLYRPYVSALAAGRRPPRPGRYLRRRVFRIVPAYWVALTALAIFPGVVGVFESGGWRFYAFMQLYWQETVGQGIPVAWSLCVEVTFYALLPLWAAGIRRLAGHLPQSEGGRLRAELAPLALVIAFGMGVQLADARGLVTDLAASSLLGQCAWIGIGMTLAVLSVAAGRAEREWPLDAFVTRHPSTCWIVSAVALAGLVLVIDPAGVAGILQSLATTQPVLDTIAVLLLTATLITGILLPAVFGENAGGLPRRLLAARPIAWLGMVSYGIFLWHLTVAQFIALPADPTHFESTRGLDLLEKLPFATTPLLLVITLAVTCVFAALSYYLVELPFLRRKEK